MAHINNAYNKESLIETKRYICFKGRSLVNRVIILDYETVRQGRRQVVRIQSAVNEVELLVKKTVVV